MPDDSTTITWFWWRETNVSEIADVYCTFVGKRIINDLFSNLVTLQPSEAIFGGGRCGSVLCARYCSIAWTTV